MGKLNGLDLFSGIGGIALALDPWVDTIAYCEKDKHATSVLLALQRRSLVPIAPIWDDVRTLRGIALPPIDLVSGGFPCQDLSLAGAGAGLDGSRSGLVFSMLRIISECRPRFVFMENVAALAVRGLDRVLLELHALGYDARWTIVSALEVGAPHQRDRIWILAHANGTGLRQLSGRSGWPRGATTAPEPGFYGACGPLAYAYSLRQSQPSGRWLKGWYGLVDGGQIVAYPESVGWGSRGAEPVADEGRAPFAGGGEAMGNADLARLEVGLARYARECEAPFGASWWQSEPNVGRVVNGLPMRVDRIKCLGNSVVPAAAREAFKRLMGVI